MDLKTYLWRSKTSQKEFAKKTGLTRQSISAYAGRKRRPKYNSACKIQKASDENISVMELLTDEYCNELQQDWVSIKKKEKKNDSADMRISL